MCMYRGLNLVTLRPTKRHDPVATAASDKELHELEDRKIDLQYRNTMHRIRVTTTNS